MTDHNSSPADAELESELRALGRSIVLPAPADRVDAILARIDQLGGKTLRGKAVCTVVAGRVVYREGASVTP